MIRAKLIAHIVQLPQVKKHAMRYAGLEQVSRSGEPSIEVFLTGAGAGGEGADIEACCAGVDTV